MPEIVYATPELVAAAAGAPLRRTVQAIAMVEGEHLYGTCGIYEDLTRTCIYIDAIDPDWIRHPREVIRGARTILELARRRGLPIHAHAVPEVPASGRFLEHFGFRRIGDSSTYELEARP
ncbi:MAG TPA: hypothetical protein VF151_10875 [Gemmatimonadales bacterium]